MMPLSPAGVTVGLSAARATIASRTPSAESSVEPCLSAVARLHLTYLWRHRRLLSLSRPTRFTELLQRRKLVDRDPRLAGLIDKLMVKRFVADRLGPAWVTPTLWSGDELPELPPCAGLCVVKSRHGCGQTEIVGSGAANWTDVRRRARSWVKRSYGGWLDEWGYRDVTRGLLIEPFVGQPPTLPIDYKLNVFHGRVEAIQVHLGRATDHRWSLFDGSWQQLSAGLSTDTIRPPETLAQMIDGAEVLGSGFDFVRIDFYDVGTTPRFGEMTFYPGSGLHRFDPLELDLMLGQLWLAQPGPLSNARLPVLRGEKPSNTFAMF